MNNSDLFINLEFDYSSNKLIAILYNKNTNLPNDQCPIRYTFADGFPQYTFFEKKKNGYEIIQEANQQNYVIISEPFCSDKYKVEVNYKVQDIIVNGSQIAVEQYIINDTINGNFISNVPIDTKIIIENNILGTVKLNAVPISITVDGSLVINGIVYEITDFPGNINGNIMGKVKNGGCRGATFDINNDISISAFFENRGTLAIMGNTIVSIISEFVNLNRISLNNISALIIGEIGSSEGGILNEGFITTLGANTILINGALDNVRAGRILINDLSNFINKGFVNIIDDSQITLDLSSESSEKINDNEINIRQQGKIILTTTVLDDSFQTFFENKNTINLFNNSSITLIGALKNFGNINLNDNSHISTPLFPLQKEIVLSHDEGNIKLSGNSSINLGTGMSNIGTATTKAIIIIKNLATFNIYKTFSDQESRTTVEVRGISSEEKTSIDISNNGRLNLYDGVLMQLERAIITNNEDSFSVINLFELSELNGMVEGTQPIGYGLFNGEPTGKPELNLKGMVYGFASLDLFPKFTDASLYGGIVGRIVSDDELKGKLIVPSAQFNPIEFNYGFQNQTPIVGQAEFLFLGTSSLNFSGSSIVFMNAEMNYLQFSQQENPVSIVCPRGTAPIYTIRNKKKLVKQIVHANDFLKKENKTLVFDIPSQYKPFHYIWAYNYRVIKRETGPELGIRGNGIYEVSANGSYQTEKKIFLLTFVAIIEIRNKDCYPYVKISDTNNNIYGILVGFSDSVTELKATLINGCKPFIFKWSIDAYSSKATVSSLYPGELISITIIDDNETTKCGHTSKNKCNYFSLD